MIDRLDKFIKSQGLSIRAFEHSISASDGMIRRAISNNTDIQSKWLCAIADKYHDLNIDWLLTGQGSMLKESLMSDHPPGDTMLYNMYKESLDKIEKQAQEIGALRKENQLLEKENSILKARVAMDAQDANTAIAENASA